LYGPYDVDVTLDGNGYQFISARGDHYLVYFTAFFLTQEVGADIEVVSFSFTCKRADEHAHNRHDPRVKATLRSLVEQFFEKNGDNALLYLCMNDNRSARSRSITFSRWFNESNKDQRYERYKSPTKYAKLGFYSSLILKKANPNREAILAAFNYTIDIYWGFETGL